MTKKSGLADSPFFQSVVLDLPLPHAEEIPLRQPVASNVQVNDRSDEQTNKRTPEHLNTQTLEHLNGRTPERMNERSSEQVNDRSDEQLIDRTDEHSSRGLPSRKSYDIYDDQAEAIEDLATRWSRERKKYVTKGQVMRELLDEIIPQKRK